MARLFISYSRQDRDLVAGLSSALKDQGHEVFFDESILTPGVDWQVVLDEALKQAEVVVTVISPASEKSQFVLTELGAALAYSKESGRLLVIPVVVRNAEIPLPIQNIQAIIDPEGNVERIANQLQSAIAGFLGSRLAKKHEQNEMQQRIEENYAVYVDEAVESQIRSERRYRLIGEIWYAIGLVALVAGLAFVGLALRHVSSPNENWAGFAYTMLRSVIVIGVLGACAKYAFSLGKAFTMESLKCADRLHAIAFGKFYLRVHGTNANWQEVKEAFANWNIDRPSAFVDTKVSDIDPKILEFLAGVAKSARDHLKA